MKKSEFDCTIRWKSSSSLGLSASCRLSFMRFGIYLRNGSQSCSCTRAAKSIGAYVATSLVAACVTSKLWSASNPQWIKSQLLTSDSSIVGSFRCYVEIPASAVVGSCDSTLAWQLFISFLYCMSKSYSGTLRCRRVSRPDGADALNKQCNELWPVMTVNCSYAK